MELVLDNDGKDGRSIVDTSDTDCFNSEPGSDVNLLELSLSLVHGRAMSEVSWRVGVGSVSEQTPGFLVSASSSVFTSVRPSM